MQTPSSHRAKVVFSLTSLALVRSALASSLMVGTALVKSALASFAMVAFSLTSLSLVSLSPNAFAQDKTPAAIQDKSATGADAKPAKDSLPASQARVMPSKEIQAARLHRAKQNSKLILFSSMFKPKGAAPKVGTAPATIDQSQLPRGKKQRELKPAVSSDPYERGKELAYRLKYDEAIKYLDKAIEKDPNQAKAYSARAYAYEGIGKHELAIADCTKAITLDPSDEEAYGTRMRAYGATRQQAPGAADERTVMHMQELKVMKSSEKYLGEINKTIQKDPRNGVHYIERGNAYRGLNQLDKAIDDYTEAIKKDPNSYLAYFSRGQAYMAMRRKDLANRDFASAQQLAQSQKPRKAHL